MAVTLCNTIIKLRIAIPIWLLTARKLHSTFYILCSFTVLFFPRLHTFIESYVMCSLVQHLSKPLPLNGLCCTSSIISIHVAVMPRKALTDLRSRQQSTHMTFLLAYPWCPAKFWKGQAFTYIVYIYAYYVSQVYIHAKLRIHIHLCVCNLLDSISFPFRFVILAKSGCSLWTYCMNSSYIHM